MTARKSERLLNLLITLLVSRSYVSKGRLREVIEPYRDAGSEAFEKMFERDKEELRSLGVPIEVGHLDRAFDDEPGYRIQRSAFELPEIELTPEEAAVVGLAARVWQHAGLAEATSDALVKLKAAGVDVDREALHVVEPQLSAEEPAFGPCWEAARTRTAIRFDYRGSADARASTRHLQPWGVVSFQGRWYVVGLDTDREAPRLFRLSRVHGDVVLDRAAGSFVVPEDVDVHRLTQSLAPTHEERFARLLLRSGAAAGLRRRALPAEGVDSEASGPTGWDRVEVPYRATDAFVEEVLGSGADVVVEAPFEVRETVVARLRELVAAPGGGAR